MLVCVKSLLCSRPPVSLAESTGGGVSLFIVYAF